MTLLIVFATLSIFASFLCSILEAVLLSVTPSFIQKKIQEGKPLGKDLEKMKKDIDRPLSAILTLNTIAHTVGAIGVGAQAATIYKDNDFMGLSYESIIAGLMTLAILVLSEIIPKTLGANYWRSLSGISVKIIKLLMLILSPFVWMSQLITKSLKNKEVHSVFSKADIMAMANVSKNIGVIRDSESKVINNLLSLDKVSVNDIMTPRSVIEMVNEEMTLNEYYESHVPFKYSRIPIFKDKSDNISGFILKDVLLLKIIDKKGDDKLSSIRRDIQMVNRDMLLHDLLEKLGEQTDHISMVVDEYGSVVGVVTFEDVLETVLGFEIVDESDIVSDLQLFAKKRWLKTAKEKGIEIPQQVED